MPELPILDEDVLAELLQSTGDDIEFVRELIDTYLADTPAQLEAIESAVAADDLEALVRPAHTLKSSSATVGAMRLSSIARELEMGARSGSPGAPDSALLEGVRAEWRAAADAFASWLDRAASG